LTFQTREYDIICLSETHVNSNFNSKNVIAKPGMDFFRQGRHLCGGGIVIASKSDLQAKRLGIVTYGKETVIVTISKLINCCYHRAHISASNIHKLNDILVSISSKDPNCMLILVGDMNLPGTDWTQNTVKSNAQYKSLDLQFMNML
jgi:exonuclease III